MAGPNGRNDVVKHDVYIFLESDHVLRISQSAVPILMSSSMSLFQSDDPLFVYAGEVAVALAVGRIFHGGSILLI